MKADQRARCETRLRTFREELLQTGDEDVSDEIDPVKKPDEDAAPLAEMAKVIASNRNRSRATQLKSVDDALQRLAEDPDNFGICEGCEEPISTRRIELSPWVKKCIECQELEDQDRLPNASRRHITDYR